MSIATEVLFCRVCATKKGQAAQRRKAAVSPADAVKTRKPSQQVNCWFAGLVLLQSQHLDRSNAGGLAVHPGGR